MAPVPSITIKKSSLFKGGSRIWGNRYHFTGGTPADAAHWLTLANAITAVEKTLYFSNHTIVEAIGYNAGSDVPVFTHAYSLAGTLSPGGSDIGTPLVNVVLARWSTAARSTRNHPIYCFSYFHGALVNNAVSGGDTVATGQKTAVQTYATDWITGFSDGSITAKRATPNGEVATGSIVEEYTTHRDFPFHSSV